MTSKRGDNVEAVALILADECRDSLFAVVCVDRFGVAHVLRVRWPRVAHNATFGAGAERLQWRRIL